MQIHKRDREQLVRDKYDGDAFADISEDEERLVAGEPLAYVIGWQPFLGLKIELGEPNSVRPLIPRPETEWWTEKLIKHLQALNESRNATEDESVKPLDVLDLCAGSGAVGLAILANVPNVRVSFGEIVPELANVIKKNLVLNRLDENRADVRTGDLFEPFANEMFDVIAVNPPYIPENRTLPKEVAQFEPHEALFGGIDGLAVLRRICADVSKYLKPKNKPRSELWIECDVSNIEDVESLICATTITIHDDLYGRPRLLVAHFE